MDLAAVGNNIVKLAINSYVRQHKGYLRQVNHIVDMAK